MAKTLEEFYENTNTQWEEMEETLQDLKVKRGSIKKTQTEESLEIKVFRNSNRNLRGKPDQQNTRDGTENVRH